VREFDGGGNFEFAGGGVETGTRQARQMGILKQYVKEGEGISKRDQRLDKSRPSKRKRKNRSVVSWMEAWGRSNTYGQWTIN
jgi:hypothetical protein